MLREIKVNVKDLVNAKSGNWRSGVNIKKDPKSVKELRLFTSEGANLIIGIVTYEITGKLNTDIQFYENRSGNIISIGYNSMKLNTFIEIASLLNGNVELVKEFLSEFQADEGIKGVSLKSLEKQTKRQKEKTETPEV